MSLPGERERREDIVIPCSLSVDTWQSSASSRDMLVSLCFGGGGRRRTVKTSLRHTKRRCGGVDARAEVLSERLTGLATSGHVEPDPNKGFLDILQSQKASA